MTPRFGTRGGFLALLVLVPLVWLTPLAYASPPDQTWIGGFYDDADFDDVVLLATSLVLALGGIVSFARLPIEAYPDVADVEVDVITLWPGHAAEEVERHITLQLEKELNGIAGVTFLRSFSNFGLSNVRILFADGTDNYWARQQVQERIAQAEIPADAHPQLGPLASVIGEVYRYTLHAKTMPLVELKALPDWLLERERRSVPGAVDVASWRGGIKPYQIT